MSKSINAFIDKMLGIEDKVSSLEKEIPLIPLSQDISEPVKDLSVIEFDLSKPKAKNSKPKVKVEFVKDTEKEEEFLISANKSRNIAKRRRSNG